MVYFACLSDRQTQRYCVRQCNLNHDARHHALGIIFFSKHFKDDIKLGGKGVLKPKCAQCEWIQPLWDKTLLMNLYVAMAYLSKLAILLHYLDSVYIILPQTSNCADSSGKGCKHNFQVGM